MSSGIEGEEAVNRGVVGGGGAGGESAHNVINQFLAHKHK